MQSFLREACSGTGVFWTFTWYSHFAIVDCVVWAEAPSLTYAYLGGDPHAASSAAALNVISKAFMSLCIALEDPSRG